MGEALPLLEEAKPEKITASTLKAAVRAKFGGSGYQVFFEVGNDTGARVSRHADAVSIGIWPSTGHAVHGFEIKVSRNDWLKEKAAPEKSLPIFQYCHRWSLVVPAGLVKPDELPPGWGLYTYSDGRLREAVMPKRMEPQPMSAGFVAAIVRRAGEQDEALVSSVLSKAREDWRKQKDDEVRREVESQLRQRERSHNAALSALKEFQDALGEPISPYQLKAIAEAVKVVRKSGVAGTYGSLRGLLNTLETTKRQIEEAVAQISMPET